MDNEPKIEVFDKDPPLWWILTPMLSPGKSRINVDGPRFYPNSNLQELEDRLRHILSDEEKDGGLTTMFDPDSV